MAVEFPAARACFWQPTAAAVSTSSGWCEAFASCWGAFNIFALLGLAAILGILTAEFHLNGAAGIVVLLVILLLMNSLAIFLGHRLQQER